MNWLKKLPWKLSVPAAGLPNQRLINIALCNILDYNKEELSERCYSWQLAKATLVLRILLLKRLNIYYLLVCLHLLASFNCLHECFILSAEVKMSKTLFFSNKHPFVCVYLMTRSITLACALPSIRPGCQENCAASQRCWCRGDYVLVNHQKW